MIGKSSKVCSFHILKSEFDELIQSIHYKTGADYLNLRPVEFPKYVCHQVIACWSFGQKVIRRLIGNIWVN